MCLVEDVNMQDISRLISKRKDMSSRFSSNSEANASISLESLEEMFPRY